MKLRKTLGALLLFTFILTGCDKDDKIDMNELTGEWSVVYDDPRLSVDGGITYTFKEDETGQRIVYDALSGEQYAKVFTYIISQKKDMISLRYEEENRWEQYRIHKLTSTTMKWTSTTMKWQSTSPEDARPHVKLIRRESYVY